jgi:hypothetical protein
MASRLAEVGPAGASWKCGIGTLMSDVEEQDDSSADEAVLKKPYAPPILVEWGTLRDITQSVGWSGRSDGGKGKQQRRTRW